MTTTTRRAALGALASVSALALPAVGAAAEPVDPIFAAIERHRAVWKLVMDAMDVKDTDPRPYEEADKLYGEAIESLMATAPLTLAGAKAAIAYFVEWDDGVDTDTGRYLETLLRSPVFAA
jgi:hypothetical protein